VTIHDHDIQPIVIGHRGACGYRPEHTLASYHLAIEQGADYIEPDLVSTRDGVLVARHENEISGTTDVADHPEFAARKATKTIDGADVTGWFTEDFTLDELKTLRAKERLPRLRPANTAFDGQFPVATFQEIIDLAQRESTARHRPIGIYPETKHPTYFRSIGLGLEEPVAGVLRQNGLDQADSPVFLQSFEPSSLQRLRALVGTPLIQLVDDAAAPYDLVVAGDPRTYADLVTPDGLEWIRTYADGVGVYKNLIVPRDANGHLLRATDLVPDAHRAGLLVHGWTFRAENRFLPMGMQIGMDPAGHGDLAAELRLFHRLGLDGVFCDFPDIAVATRAG
jgi:glycerophosphoryl diester phosphodiesterase